MERKTVTPRGTPAHAEEIVERAKREARLEWTEERTALLRAPGLSPDGLLVVELPGLGWMLVQLERGAYGPDSKPRSSVSGTLFTTREEAQAEALSYRALELALAAAQEEGANEWAVSDAFYGTARDNVVAFKR